MSISCSWIHISPILSFLQNNFLYFPIEMKFRIGWIHLSKNIWNYGEVIFRVRSKVISDHEVDWEHKNLRNFRISKLCNCRPNYNSIIQTSNKTYKLFTKKKKNRNPQIAPIFISLLCVLKIHPYFRQAAQTELILLKIDHGVNNIIDHEVNNIYN